MITTASIEKLLGPTQVQLSREIGKCIDHHEILKVFKWNETQIKVSEILKLAPQQPLFGNTSGKRAGTHWMVFMKESQS